MPHARIIVCPGQAGVSRRLSTPAGWALALLVAAVFSGLGVWQLGRAKQKRAMLEQVAQVLHDRQPRPLADAAQHARAQEFDWAAGSGRFAPGPAVLLDNQTHQGQAGVRAYRVFVPDAGGAPLLVDLGWQPLDAQRQLPPVPALADTHRVAGLLAPPPSAGLLRAPAQAQANGDLLAVVLDPAALAAPLRQPALAQRVLKLDPALPVGFPRDLDVLPNTLPPERHLGYAVQWFGLALAVLITAGVLTWRRRRAAREKMGA